MAIDHEYEAKHTVWRAAKADLDAALAKQRHSVFPDVNAERQPEQRQVRAEINAAQEAEKAARKDLDLPWERD
jgi:hypothetical protein